MNLLNPLFTTIHFQKKNYPFLKWQLFFGCLLFAFAIHAQKTWTGTTNSDWNTASNWQTGTVPTAADDVIIPDVANDPVIIGGASAVVNSVTVEFDGYLSIANGGSLETQGASPSHPVFPNETYGILNLGRIDNNGSISVVATASIPDFGFAAKEATINNYVTGSISIDDPAVDGLFIWTVEFNNYGTTEIGINSTSALSRYGIGTVLECSINNFAGAILNITNFVERAISLQFLGALYNEGLILINEEGTPISSGKDGLFAQGTVTNTATAEIKVDHVTENAITLFSSAPLFNSGLLEIGANSPSKSIGTGILGNNENITNQASANINIDNVAQNAVVNGTGLFENYGNINIGQSGGPGSINGRGLFWNGQFDNWGIVNIDHTTFDAIEFTNGVSNNYGTINIGRLGDIAELEAFFVGSPFGFINHSCAIINIASNNVIQGLLTNGITNNGLIIENGDGTSVVTENNGIIQNLNGGSFSIFNNNEIVIEPATGNCNVASPAFDLGAVIDFNIIGVFTDENATQSAGIYDVSTNTFTANAGLGQSELYVQIEDPDNGCTRVVSWSADILDSTLPVSNCFSPTVQLDANGSYTLLESDVFDMDNSSDNCGTVNFVSADPATVDCSNVSNPVTVTVTINDGNGNENTCTATVTVEDNLSPVITCADATVELNADGEVTITQATTFTGSSDNCGFIGLEPLAQEVFNCDDIGENTVVLNGFDGNGNTTSCEATVTIEDNIAPDASCVASPISATLNANGEYTIDPANLNDGSSDACGIQSLVASTTLLDCSNEGTNLITLTVTDVNGNTNTCTATVEVVTFFSINNITENDETCTGLGDGSIVIDATTSSGQLGYSIDGGVNFQFGSTFTSLIPGTYNIVVKLFGINHICEKTATATVEAGSQSQVWYRDQDGDQYSDGTTLTACAEPAGYYPAGELLATSGDCNDNDPEEYPGQTWYEDFDSDGHSSGNTLTACQRPAGYYTVNELTATNGDCDDREPSVHPGATETCNGIDDDCDGEIDEGTTGGLTYTGNVAFDTQAAVDAFSACYSIIDGNVIITGIDITDLSNLFNIEEITGDLTIQITGLINMNGLDNLVDLGGTLTIYFNSSLTSLDGLDALGTVGGNLSIYYNFSLSDACAIYNLINGGVSGSMIIFFNAVGANSVAEINANCGPNNRIAAPNNPVELNASSLDQTTKARTISSVRVFPNPALYMATVQLESSENTGTVRLLDLTGRTLLEQKVQPGSDHINLQLSDLKAGTYFVQVKMEGHKLLTKKLIVID